MTLLYVRTPVVASQHRLVVVITPQGTSLFCEVHITISLITHAPSSGPSGAFQSRASIFTQRFCISYVWGYSSMSICQSVGGKTTTLQ